MIYYNKYNIYNILIYDNIYIYIYVYAYDTNNNIRPGERGAALLGPAAGSLDEDA